MARTEKFASSGVRTMDRTFPIIDTEKFSAQLRRRGILIDEKKILLTKFVDTKQQTDFTVPPNCGGFGRIHHFRRHQGASWPDNPLPIDPAAKALNLGDLNQIEAQVFQNAICSWRCWYCFVDFELLSANHDFAEFKTMDELLDLYVSEATPPRLIDLSGGQPDLVPEWSWWFLEAADKRGLLDRVYVWSDDNLSNDYLWRYLKQEQISYLADCPRYGRVGCFKGFDQHSFSFNTKASPELFEQQFALMRRLVDSGFDVYGYATFTATDDSQIFQRMKDFVDRLQERVHDLFPLRTIPLRILPFAPTRDRVGKEEARALEIQQEATAAWSEELRRRYSLDQLNARITEHHLGTRQDS
jgi:uncharacterized Fe-S cluster-containing radical SAM superfamily protein